MRDAAGAGEQREHERSTRCKFARVGRRKTPRAGEWADARSPAEVKERQGAFDSFILGMEGGSFPRCTGVWIGAQFSQICVLALLWHGYRFQKLKLGQDRLESKVGIALLLCNFNT